MEVRISIFLFQYRVTLQTTTGVSPAELLMGRRLRMHLDLLHPDTASKVADKREKSIPQKQQGNLLSDKNSMLKISKGLTGYQLKWSKLLDH